MGTSNVEPLYGPTAPCAKNPDEWIRLEAELEAVISRRASRKRKTEAAQPMVEQFCAQCPIVADCYEIAAAGVGTGKKRPQIQSLFTGVAGATLFHESKVVIDFGIAVAAGSSRKFSTLANVLERNSA